MRLVRGETMVLVVDIQERLMVHMDNHEELEANMNKLLQGVTLFDMPLFLNEQYPQGLGHTISSLREQLPHKEVFEKVTFSCCQNASLHEALLTCKKKSAIVFGIETHVCVMQTCLDLVQMGIQPFLVVDCSGSRKRADHEIALHRMVQAGVIPMTYESVLFELCDSAKDPVFKAMSQIVK
ncbi:hydrolase [Sulfurospirillum deleyianum]|uniref:Isochorismatase hydrolase n=1 Tax=Sulfurospirillum deleyianum (strain ATCC 51133 / DSM 6946 / 5175) TaxID=525898 RepID=D1B0M8_SULD5|nr:hydrolase [Sulfurospirillum deleyianum]ACZ11347.1 isochorismatase hydrolase [Sulfurospirillum deleyianum DSM 6946]